jgi:hypothetical protein
MPKHTLEKIAEEMGDKFDEKKLHAGLLLAYTQTVYDVMRRNTVPTPLYRITYDEANNSLTLQETDGKSFVPTKNSLDIDSLDIVFTCSLRGIPVVFEGDTGTGKTYVENGFLKTVFPRTSTFSLRLSGSAYESIPRYFLKGMKDEGGMPKSVVNEDIINRTAGMLIDEPNRGDPDELLQLLDNTIFHDGQYYRLGIKIPEIDADKKVKDSGKRKKVIITSAINPANAKYSGTVELDAAVDNRFIRLPYGNSAVSAGSTLWLSDSDVKNHDLFLKSFSKRAAKYLGLKESALEDINDDWLSMYAYITDPNKTNKRILYSALELADSMIYVLSGNLPNSFEYEKEIAKSWNDKLNLDMQITEKLSETQNIKRIQEIVDTFKVPIIFRDIDQIKKLADVVTTLENLRDAFSKPDPVRAYLDMSKYISTKEIAMGTALLARNKQNPNSPNPTNVINEVLNNYISLAGEYHRDVSYLKESFDIYDPNDGIKKIAIVKGIRNTIKKSEGVDTLIKEVVDNTKKLKSHISASYDVRNAFIMRNTADLLTFAGFVDQYRDEIEPMFKKYDKNTDMSKVVNDLGKFYYNKREELAMVLPEIYQHRIQRTLGV